MPILAWQSEECAPVATTSDGLILVAPVAVGLVRPLSKPNVGLMRPALQLKTPSVSLAKMPSLTYI